MTKEHQYFNPFRKNHVELLQYLEGQVADKNYKVDMYKFGDNTQHIFINDKYFMTVNWSLV